MLVEFLRGSNAEMTKFSLGSADELKNASDLLTGATLDLFNGIEAD